MLWTASSLLALVATFALAAPAAPAVNKYHTLSARANAGPSFTIGSAGAAAQKKAAASKGAVGQATDGSKIIGMEAQISGIAFQL